MSHDHSRRASTTHSPQAQIPKAPPLPGPRPLQRARDAATRLFGYASRPPSPQQDERSFTLNRSRFASLSADRNASTSHRTGLEINTISINEAGTHALLGGKEIFKTVRVEDGTCVEELNLRSAIRSTPTQASGKTRQVYSINIADVAWAKGDCGDYVAAATSSGKIILYDIAHAGLQAAQLHEHARQVHKVTFNPHRGSYLLSGSQDGTVRLWDVRTARNASTIKSKHKYSGQADGIRDVKWSPTEGVDFAFGTDSGWIQRWDMRNLRTAMVKIAAHSVTCNAIDWHPDGKHIASASVDKTVRIWDFSVHRRQKPHWEIKTPHPVLNARWRPSCESSAVFDSGARQCTQIVTSYDEEHPMLHMWDLRRPLLPFRELSPYQSAPTDLLWHSQDLLWTVGKDGVFLQTDIQYAPKSISKRNLQAFAVSSSGEINLITQRRRKQRVQRANGSGANPDGGAGLGQPRDDGLLSRSWADDSVDHSFLSMHPAQRNISPRSKTRTQSLSISASANEGGSSQSTAHLDDVLSHRRAFRPPQSAGRGSINTGVDASAFTFLASRLELDVDAALRSEELVASFQLLMDRNAHLYDSVGMYRMSQSVKMACVMMRRHLEDRGRANVDRQDRMQQSAVIRYPLSRSGEKVQARAHDSSPADSPAPLRPLSSLAQQISQSETASNNRTPQPRPAPDTKSTQNEPNVLSSDLDDSDTLALPPLVVPKEQHYETMSLASKADPPLTRSNLVGLQQHQETNSFGTVDMVHRWSVQPTDVFASDAEEANGMWIAPKLQKHDSNESFAFLAESADSRDPSFPASLVSNESSSGPLRMVSERPSRTDIKTDGSLLGVGKVDFAARPAPTMVGSAAIVLEQAVRTTTEEEARPLETKEPLRDVLHSVKSSVNPSPNIGPGSYPDENGISPLLHLRLPTIMYDQDQQPTQPQKEVPPQPRTFIPETSLTKPLSQEEFSRAPTKTASVFVPQDGDIDVEIGKPYTMLGMLREVLHQHTNKANAQAAAQFVLLLAPLLPRTAIMTDVEAEATARVYIDAFTAAGFAHDGIVEIMRSHLDPFAKSGLQPLQIETILETYHEQLLQSGLLNEAGAIRKLSYPAYPAVYEQALKDNYVKLMCGSCRKPMTTGMTDLTCETCGTQQAVCPVCSCRSSPFEASKPASAGLANLLTTCMLCNHSGHAACMQAWFSGTGQNDGGCPVAGCLCDCVDGQWRAQKLHMAEQKRPVKNHGRVKSDEWSTHDSNAVERARAVLLTDGDRLDRSKPDS